ncbi:MAG: hypothetical protein DDG59_01515 [Anaerolineae bacterium]|jgi:hypothetical protein|nr:MAG: hypothetical protein DDG59_01515 [Anaerolineae bacterium]
MQTIRRLYFYAVTLVSLETVIWGGIGLMRTVFSPGLLGATADRLAAPLAFILVGLPVFWIHWRAVQSTAAQNADEARSRLRAVFFYVALGATFLPAAQNTLAFLSRSLTQAFGMDSQQALLGGQQTLVDNAVAVAINLLFAAYLYRRNQQNWSGEVCPELTEQDQAKLLENYADARRLYRYFWLAYALILSVFGVRQLFNYLLLSPQVLGTPAATLLANGLALLAIGLPIWAYTQRLVDHSLQDSAEASSWLRIGFLYGATWLAMFLTLYQVGKIGEVIFRVLFGEGWGIAAILQSLRPAIALGIPTSVVWGWYGRQRQEAVHNRQPPLLQAAMERVHSTVVAGVAFLAILLGSSRLLGFVVNQLFGAETYFSTSGRTELSTSLAILLIAVPVWLRYWLPLQRQATQEGEAGDYARRSLVRRGTLYLWIFVGVVGTMFATGSFFFEILRAVLGTPSDTLALESLLRLRLSLIFLTVLIYYILTLRRDQRLAAAALAARQAGFPVAIGLAKDSQLAKELADVLQKEAPHLPVFWLEDNGQASAESLKQAKALVLSAQALEAAASDGQRWWQTFEGQRLVVPDPHSEWYWVGGSTQPISTLAKQTARALRLLAEGQALPRQSENPILTSIAYVLAVLFLLQFALAILLAGIAPLVD